MVFVPIERGPDYEREFIMKRIAVADRGHATPCWIWQSGINSMGYATSKPSGFKSNKLMHRYSYEAFVGPIDFGLVVDHLCRVKSCVNPTHLEPVTQSENVLRGLAAARKSGGRGIKASSGQGDIAHRNGSDTK